MGMLPTPHGSVVRSLNLFAAPTSVTQSRQRGFAAPHRPAVNLLWLPSALRAPGVTLPLGTTP